MRHVAFNLLAARTLRQVSYGCMAIILPIYWHEEGLSVGVIGLLFTLALLGSSTLTIVLARFVDRLGRRRLLVIVSLLWFLTAFLLFTRQPAWLAVLAILGSVSPNGKEVGPFLAVEQAALTRLYAGQSIVNVYAWFNLIGYTSTALGALLASLFGLAKSGVISGLRGSTGGSAGGSGPTCSAFGTGPAHLAKGLAGHATHAADGNLGVFHAIIIGYALVGLAQFILYALLPREIEMTPKQDAPHGGGQKQLNAEEKKHYVPEPPVRRLVYIFSALFAMDAMGTGFVVQGLLVAWFQARYGLDITQIGLIFFGTNVLAAISSLAAARIAKSFGLLNTMVFTHLPSNILLIIMPLMPTARLAVGVLLLRNLFSQMDVPTRQAYTMAMVKPEDRAYMSAWTNGVRHYGTGIAPFFSGAMMVTAATGLPFFIGGTLKSIYDLMLYMIFRRTPLEHSDSR